MITLKYKNGDHLIINEDKQFALDSRTEELLSIEHLTAKLLDIASDRGKYSELYYACLSVNGDKLVERGPFLINKPLTLQPEVKTSTDLTRVKTMKKNSKGFYFTHRIKWSSDALVVYNIKQAA